MKKFSFSLEKVMKLRKYREEEAKVELGRAVGALTEIENNIQMTAVARSSAAKQRFSGLAAADNCPIPVWDNYINRLDQQTQQLLEEAAKAELIVEAKREDYLAASRELKVLEKLKEKREKEYRKESFDAETRELDDIPRPGLNA